MRRLSALLVAVVAAVLSSCPAAALAVVNRPAVIVVGVPGLRWDEVSAARTPNLWRLTENGSAGALSIRSAAATTCPADGWLTIGAGNRVRAGRVSSKGCQPVPGLVARVGDTATVDGYASMAADNHRLDFGAVPGILASSVADSGQGCVASLGAGAALAAADRAGAVLALGDLTAAALAQCVVTIVTGPTVAGVADAANADSLVAEVDAERPAGSVLIVLGLSDTDPQDRAHLHVAIADGGPFRPAELRSQSTRRAPYVQLIDVAATVLDLRGLQDAKGVSAAVDGQPWRSTGGPAPPAGRVSQLADADRAAGAVRSAIPYGVVLLVALVVAGLAAGAAARRTGRPIHSTVACWILLIAAAGPAATYLSNVVPWWRTGAPTAFVLLLTGGVALLLGSAATVLAERASAVTAAGAVAGVTYLILLADVVTGSRLQMDSILGYSPLVAGRFIGFGNVAYGVFGSAALLTATSAAILRTRSRWLVAALGVLAVVADGAPMWGSDVGGVLALIPGFAVMLLLGAQVRVSWRKALAIAAAAVAVVLGFGLLDYARPASAQTHLGRFIGKILHGGAVTVLERKAQSDLDLLTANAATLLVPVVVAVAIWLVVRPRPRLALAYTRQPQLRYGLISLVVLGLVGLVVNDSGLAIPAVAVLLAVPYVGVLLVGRPRAESSTTR